MPSGKWDAICTGVSQTAVVTLAFNLKQCVEQIYDGLYQLHTYTFNYKNFTLKKIILHDFIERYSQETPEAHSFPISP